MFPGSLPATSDTAGSETLLPTPECTHSSYSSYVHTGYLEITNPTPVHTSMEEVDVKFRRPYVSPPNYKMLENNSRFFKLLHTEQCNRQS
jgi:hypothetical protein